MTMKISHFKTWTEETDGINREVYSVYKWPEEKMKDGFKCSIHVIEALIKDRSKAVMLFDSDEPKLKEWAITSNKRDDV